MSDQFGNGGEAGPLPVKMQARLAGLLYLFIIVAGVGAEMAARSHIVDGADAALTARNIVDSSLLYRSSIVAEILMIVCDVGVALLLYEVLKPAGRALSLLAAFFRLVSVAVSGVKALLLLTPLQLLSGADYLSGFSSEQLAGFSLLAIKLHGTAYNISLVFFAFCCFAKGALIIKARFMPSWLGVLVLIAGACYFVNSFGFFLAPAFAASLYPMILMPCLAAELALMLWLLIVGVNEEKWRAQAAGAM